MAAASHDEHRSSTRFWRSRTLLHLLKCFDASFNEHVIPAPTDERRHPNLANITGDICACPIAVVVRRVLEPFEIERNKFFKKRVPVAAQGQLPYPLGGK